MRKIFLISLLSISAQAYAYGEFAGLINSASSMMREPRPNSSKNYSHYPAPVERRKLVNMNGTNQRAVPPDVTSNIEYIPDPELLKNGLWRDPASNQIWMLCHGGENWNGSGCEGKSLFIPWRDAMQYVENMNKNNFAGFNDWRMPSQAEFNTLLFDKNNLKDLTKPNRDVFLFKAMKCRPDGFGGGSCFLDVWTSSISLDAIKNNNVLDVTSVSTVQGKSVITEVRQSRAGILAIRDGEDNGVYKASKAAAETYYAYNAKLNKESVEISKRANDCIENLGAEWRKKPKINDLTDKGMVVALKGHQAKMQYYENECVEVNRVTGGCTKIDKVMKTGWFSLDEITPINSLQCYGEQLKHEREASQNRQSLY